MNKNMLNYAKITVQFMAQRGQPREYCFYKCLQQHVSSEKTFFSCTIKIQENPLEKRKKACAIIASS